MANRNGSGTIRVLVMAASAVRRAGLETLIRNNPDLKLVASLQGSKPDLPQVRQLSPDVLLIDLERAFSWMAPAPANKPATIVLIDEPSSDWAAQALRHGVKSILPRDAAPEDIFNATRSAHVGLVLLDPEVTLALASRVPERPGDDDGAPRDQLTPRELEVLHLLADGLGNRQIASRLGVSDHTVKFHISSILDKLGATTRTEAVTMGIRAGMILL